MKLFFCICVVILIYVLYIISQDSINIKQPKKLPRYQNKCYNTSNVLKNPSTYPEKSLPNILKNKVSLAISGGGTRSYVASIGYFRAITKMRLKFRYVSTVSGSSWFYGLYYSLCPEMEDGDQRDKTFDYLGESCDILNASLITKGQLQSMNMCNKLYFGHLVIDRDLLFFNKSMYGKKLSDRWHNAVSELFLLPYGLEDSECVYDETKPYWLCNSTISIPTIKKREYINTSMTPLYSGIRYGMKIDEGRYIGNCLIENKYFGSIYISELDDSHIIVSGNGIKLKHMIGYSSSAYANIIEQTEHDLINIIDVIIPCDKYELLPKINIISCGADNVLSNISCNMIDGGFCDNTGILSLLSRGEDRIISLINTNILIRDFITEGETNILSLFGVLPNKSKFYSLSMNEAQVFSSSEYKYILDQFNECIERKIPVYARRKLTVMPNKMNDISGGYEVDILFIVLQPCLGFELMPEIYDICPRFPLYNTACQNIRSGLTKLSVEEVNLLSSYTEWIITQPEISRHILEMYS